MPTIDDNLINALKDIQAGMALRAECNNKVTVTNALLRSRNRSSEVPDALVNEGREGAARKLAETYLHLIAATEAFEAAHGCTGLTMSQLAAVAAEYSKSAPMSEWA